MILSTSVGKEFPIKGSNKNDLIEAEKTSILNQILYVVRNMLLFDFSEKEVKEFTNKFVKMLKQDDRFLKDVYVKIKLCREVSTMPFWKRQRTSRPKQQQSLLKRLHKWCNPCDIL